MKTFIFQPLCYRNDRLPLHPEIVHRLVTSGEEHQAEYDEPKQVLGEDQPEWPEHFTASGYKDSKDE